MIFPGGFGPCLAYDGFLEKADNGFESCLCAVGKRVWWNNKQDVVRHLWNLHFGLAEGPVHHLVTTNLASVQRSGLRAVLKADMVKTIPRHLLQVHRR